MQESCKNNTKRFSSRTIGREVAYLMPPRSLPSFVGYLQTRTVSYVAIKVGKLTLTHYYHLISDFTQVQQVPVTFFKAKGITSCVWATSCMWFSCLFNPLAFGQFPSFLDSHDLGTPSWLESGDAFLTGKLRKGCCILLTASCQMEHNFNWSPS